jgi:hypothetical protein
VKLGPGKPTFSLPVRVETLIVEAIYWLMLTFVKILVIAVCDTVAVVFIYLSLLQWMAPTGWNGRRVAAFTAAVR